MSTNNICFYGEIWKSNPKLSSNTHLTCSTEEPAWSFREENVNRFDAYWCCVHVVHGCLCVRYSDDTRKGFHISFCLRNRSALAVNCWVIIHRHCLEISCKGDQITSVKHEWFMCLQLTNKLNYYSTIHALELIYFDSNTQETMKKQLCPSDSFNFPPLQWRNPAKGLTVTQAFSLAFACISYVNNAQKWRYTS